MRGVAALALAAAMFAVPVSGRPRPQDQDQSVKLGTAEVAVDVVVRDKDGRPVKDLTKADFEIAEDGVTQEIASFRLVARDPGAAPDSSAGLTSVSAVALVFDRLSPEGRDLAKQAALRFTDESMGPSDLVGVFTVDLTMHVIQPFTSDPKLVRAALERVAGVADTPAVNTNRELVRKLEERQVLLERQLSAAESGAAAAAQAGGNPGSAISSLAAERIANRMTLQSIERFDDLERDQAGQDVTDGLLSVVSGLGKIPGRKAVIFFSEGIEITTNTERPFQSVVGNANRANVSFYAVDAGGLRGKSEAQAAGSSLVRAGNERILDNASGNTGGTTGPMMRDMERNENTMRQTAEFGLRELSVGTGGLLINNTNDPGKRLRLVDDDLRQHYALTYAPKNQDFDGRFREIAVKVKRPGVQIQTRRGYLAVNAASDVTLLPSEAPAFAALTNGAAAVSPSVRVLPMSFPELAREGHVKILVEVPASAFSVVDEGANSKTDFTILAVVRDAEGRVATKVSRHYPLAGTTDWGASFRKSNVLFSKDATIGSGEYTVEAVAYDALGKKASLGRSKISVPPATSAVRLSSVIIVDHGEKLTAADMATPDPLFVGDMLIYPNFGAPLEKKSGKLSFFAIVYTKPGAGTPKLTLEIGQGGQTLAQLPVDVPAPDDLGRAQIVNALPLEAFPPGNYVLRFVLTDGKETVARSSPFTVKD